jgi:hypothetical protein
MWPWGRENWINNLSPFHIRLSLGDWLRPVVKSRGVGINRVFFVTFAVTVFYSIFGSGTWFFLSLVGPADVVEFNLEAPSSSANAWVCSQNWFWFGDLKFCLEFVWLPGVWLAGNCSDTSQSRRGNRTDGGLGLGSVCMFGLLSFCRFKIMV